MPHQGFPLLLDDVTDKSLVCGADSDCADAARFVRLVDDLVFVRNVDESKLCETEPHTHLQGLAWPARVQHSLNNVVDCVQPTDLHTADVDGGKLVEELRRRDRWVMGGGVSDHTATATHVSLTVLTERTEWADLSVGGERRGRGGGEGRRELKEAERREKEWQRGRGEIDTRTGQEPERRKVCCSIRDQHPVSPRSHRHCFHLAG